MFSVPIMLIPEDTVCVALVTKMEGLFSNLILMLAVKDLLEYYI